MTYFEANTFTGTRSGFVSRQGARAFALALLLAGCTAGTAGTPGDGTGGTAGLGMTGDAGAGGGDVGAGGQGGAVGTMSVQTCDGVPPSGIGVPAGTVTTASAADDTDPAANAIDGDIVDEWSTGTTSGWITLTFPAPVMIGAIRIHADAKPANNEIFTVSTSTSTVPLASLTATIMTAPTGTLLPEVEIPPGLYRDITLTVNAGSSWVGVNEIWLLPAATCP